MTEKVNRKYLTINEIQKEYLPVSKKRIRLFVKKYLNVKMIGNRIFIDREHLEALLDSPDRSEFPLGD